MNLYDVVTVLVPSFGGLVVAAALLVWLLAQNKKPVPTSRMGNGQVRPYGAVGAPDAWWQAKVVPGGTILDDALWGRLVLSQGRLSFVPDDQPAWGWTFSVRQLRVARRGLLRSRLTLDLWLPDQTVLGLVVSQTTINRVIDNGFKDLAQLREADVFLQLMAANGAQVGTVAQAGRLSP